jgi:hypothetical protein
MSVVEQKKERIRSALQELDHPTCIELGFPKSGPTLLYEGNKAAINRDLVLNALGTSIMATARRHQACTYPWCHRPSERSGQATRR